MKIKEVLSKNKYYRLEVGKDGKVLGGLFRYANTLMNHIDNIDPDYEDTYGDDIYDSINKLEYDLKVPDVNWNGEDKEVVRCAFTQETFNEHKDTIDILQNALEHFGYQLIKKEVQPDEDAIIYEDKDQIVYWDDMANIKPFNESFLTNLHNSTLEEKKSNKKDNKGNTLTDEQASFFKDSKIRDEEGNLLVCYHGSENDFDEFKQELIGSGNHSLSNVGLFGKGFYFSNHDYIASNYGKVNAYYLNIKNPFIYADYRDSESAHKIVKDTGLNFRLPYSSYYEDTYLSFLDTIEDQTNFTKYLIEKGYDGIIASDPHTPNDLEIVAFDSNQIKLITNTNPTTSNKVNESLLESHNEVVKDKTGREFNIWTESTGGYGDQHDWMKIAYLGDNWLDDNDRVIKENLLGFLEYATDDGDNCYVQMIQVKDTEQRKGIASELIKSLQKEYENINYGFTTNDGTQLLKSLGIRENLVESNYGYHAGDLGKSEYYGSQSSGRGTGHFGTGTYFVGDPNRIKGYNDYQYGKGEAPHHIVDFSSYNLYKPSTNKKGYELHDTLKLLDGSYTYWKDKVDDVNTVKKYEGRDKRRYDKFTEQELEELIGALNRLDSDEPLNYEYISNFLVPENFDKYYEELIFADLDTDRAFDDQYEVQEQLYDKVQEWTDWRVLNAVKNVSNIENKLYQALEGRVSMSRIKQGLSEVVDAQKRYEANRDKKVDSLATVFMKSLGYEGIDTRHLNKDDHEEGLAGLDNTGYGSVIYDIKPNTIVESYEGKTFTFPKEIVDKCIDYYKETYPTIKVDKLSIEQLVKDNDLLNDEDLQSYHQRQWDNKSAKEFSIDQDKISTMRVSEVPFVVKKKDKLELVDGRHRVRALYNDGYNYVELPVVEESLAEGFWTTKKSRWIGFDGKQHEKEYGEYKPENDNKYKRLCKKPINILTEDEVVYIYAVRWTIYMAQTIPYQTPEEAIEDILKRKPNMKEDLTECYNFIHTLSFPLTIYRGLRVGNFKSSELNIDTKDLIISGKHQSYSWTTDINIYKNPTSKFRNLTQIVACEIDSNIIDVANTIFNFIHYSAGGEYRVSYPENEITLKNNFKQSDLHNLRFINKDEINEMLSEGLTKEVDSEGNQLTQEQINFFKDSKVRDSQGRLLVCYHGTDADFDTFKKEFMGTNPRFKIQGGGYAGANKGFFFTNDKWYASHVGRNVKKCYLNITNPLNVKDFGWGSATSQLDRRKGDIYRWLEEGNNDGIIVTETDVELYKNPDDLNDDTILGFDTVFVVFDSNQIKSIDNKNPSDSDNIYEMLEEE